MNSRFLNIAFSGAGGTGKSTTALKLMKDYNKSFLRVPSYVNILRLMYYGENAKYGDMKSTEEIIKFQQSILFSQITAEKQCKELAPNKNLVIDRSSIDYAAYLEKERNRISHPDMSKYTSFCVDYANKNYDLIVYFPIGIFSYVDNETSKERNIESIKQTDAIINNLLSYIDNNKILILKSTDINERVQEIYNMAEKIRKNKEV